MKQLIKQLKQLQQTTERDHENSELILDHALELEKQKWKVCGTRLSYSAAIDETIEKAAALKDKNETKRTLYIYH